MFLKSFFFLNFLNRFSVIVWRLCHLSSAKVKLKNRGGESAGEQSLQKILLANWLALIIWGFKQIIFYQEIVPWSTIYIVFAFKRLIYWKVNKIKGSEFIDGGVKNGLHI